MQPVVMQEGLRKTSRVRAGVAAAGLLAAASLAAPAWADIDLEFRPAAQSACVGDVVRVELYSVSDDPEMGQLWAAIQLIIGWDPDALQLIGNDDTGAVDLLVSGFPTPDPHNLNEADPPGDGDAFYQAFAPLGSPVEATPEGTLVTTILFMALQDTALTTIEMLESGGDPQGFTIVFDGTVPNTNVTGTLNDGDVSISLSCPGDVNCDGIVDVDDLVDVVLAWGLCPTEGCPADTNDDGEVDVDDLVNVVLGWGVCPP